MDVAAGADDALPAEMVGHVLAVLGEALANVARHAAASHVTVRLAREGDDVSLAVCDDGCGFDPAQAMPAGHYGLLGMHERARLIGGRLMIESAPGQGTCVRLAAPAMTLMEQGA